MEGITFKKAGATAYSSSEDDSSEDEFLRPSTNPAADDRDYPPRKRRRMHGGADAKEKAALGIFGSDSDDDGPGRKWKSKNLRGKGVGFVSQGTKEFRLGDEYSGDDDDDESDDKNGDAMDVDEEDIEAALEEENYDEDEEVGGGHRGLGFSEPVKPHANGSKPKDQKPAIGPSFQRSAFDSATPFGKGFVPSSAYDPVLRDDLDDSPAAPKKAMPSAFSGAKPGRGGKAGKINPQGFGAKMLAKMGYVEGKGLGKEGQGRNIIIEANLRPQGIGLGAVQEKTDQERKEEKRQAKLRGEEVSDSEEEKRKKARKRQQDKAKNKFGGVAGFDSASSTPKRPKTKYLTAEEIKRAAPGLHIPDAFMPILDMTGPGSRIVTSASGLSTPTATSAAPESAEAAATRKMLRQAHRDLSAFSEEWKSLLERKTWVDKRLGECEQELENLGLDYQRLQDFSDVVATELPAAGSDWLAVIQCLHKAASLGPETPETAAILVAAMEPFFKDPAWDPLKEPRRYAEDMRGLEALLLPTVDSGTSVERADAGVFHNKMDGVFRHHQRSTTAYESLMYKLWLPRALRALRDADIHDPDPLLALLASWEPLLPPFVRAEFIDNVARRLHSALTDWNPRMAKRQHQGKNKGQKQQPLPHIWLFPWLPHLPPYHLDPRGTGLLSDVRRKFRTLIEAWPHDQGPIPGLASWEGVLGRGEWRSLVVSHVIPSMARHLERNFRVDPADQEPYMAALDGVLAWEGVLPARYVAEVVAGKVFPLWHLRLKEWLALPGEGADLGEVADWFEWWGGYFSGDVGRLVRGEFERGLLTMEKMLDRMTV